MWHERVKISHSYIHEPFYTWYIAAGGGMICIFYELPTMAETSAGSSTGNGALWIAVVDRKLRFGWKIQARTLPHKWGKSRPSHFGHNWTTLHHFGLFSETHIECTWPLINSFFFFFKQHTGCGVRAGPDKAIKVSYCCKLCGVFFVFFNKINPDCPLVRFQWICSYDISVHNLATGLNRSEKSAKG